MPDIIDAFLDFRPNAFPKQSALFKSLADEFREWIPYFRVLVILFLNCVAFTSSRAQHAPNCPETPWQSAHNLFSSGSVPLYVTCPRWHYTTKWIAEPNSRSRFWANRSACCRPPQLTY